MWISQTGQRTLLYSHSNLTNDLQVQMGEIRNTAEDSRDIREAAENNWLNKILHEIGEWSLKEWLASLPKGLTCVVVIISNIELRRYTEKYTKRSILK